MEARWAVVVVLFATACGGVFEAAPSGDDDSGLDASGADVLPPDGAQGPDSGDDGGRTTDGGGRRDGGRKADGGGASDSGDVMDGGGGGMDGGDVDGGSPKDARPEDTGPEDAAKDASKDSGADEGDAGGWSTVCPATAPTAGTPCSVDGVQCEYPRPVYGDKLQYDVACDNVLECSAGAWSSASLGAGTCDPDSTNSTDCPLSLAGITSGASCSDLGLRCEYPKGVCTCAATLLGGVLPVLDAGGSWSCDPETACPMPRPRLGIACATAKQTCTYQTCSFGEVCQGGVWQGEPEVCAGL
jgi:hypothetical protein